MVGDKGLQPCWFHIPLADMQASTYTHVPDCKRREVSRIPGDQSRATLRPVERLPRELGLFTMPCHHRLPEPPGPHVGPSSARPAQGQCLHFYRIRKKGKGKNQGGCQFPTFSDSLTLNSQSLGCSTEVWAGVAGVASVGGCGRCGRWRCSCGASQVAS